MNQFTGDQNQLADWLAWQETLHHSTIDLGLDRIRTVATALGLLAPNCPIITCGGTNGKGSTVTLLANMAVANGLSVGSFTSPHILHYNERIQLNLEPVSDQQICQAFQAIDAVRNNVSLTYFEFNALAAMWIFMQHPLDLIVLEVGLGGRLDATNLWDSNAAIITSIGIDHIDWLGDNREQIGQEKVAICRTNKPLICGDLDPPNSIASTAKTHGAQYLQLGRDFHWQAIDDQSIEYWSNSQVNPKTLAKPVLAGDVQANNVACAITALVHLDLLKDWEATSKAIKATQLIGRMQVIREKPLTIVDVAHNPEAAAGMADWLRKNPNNGKTIALFSVLLDKDLEGILQVLSPEIDHWIAFAIDDFRGRNVENLSSTLRKNSLDFTVFKEISSAWEHSENFIQDNDRLVIFGSFLVLSKLITTKVTVLS